MPDRLASSTGPAHAGQIREMARDPEAAVRNFSQAVFSVNALDDQSRHMLTINGLVADQILEAIALAFETRGQSVGHACEYLCRTRAVMHDTPR